MFSSPFLVSDIILSPSQAATPFGEEDGHVMLMVTLETETEPCGPGCLLFYSADGPRLSKDRFLGASCPQGSYRATCAMQAAHFLGTPPPERRFSFHGGTIHVT